MELSRERKKIPLDGKHQATCLKIRYINEWRRLINELQLSIYHPQFIF